MAPFGGFDMPVQYAGIQAEHDAVRNEVGLFDVGHMGEFVVTGNDALQYLQKVTINDVSALAVGQAQYSAMCRPDGGIVDDLLVYRRAQDYLLVVNASNIDKDFRWLESHLEGDASITDKSDEYGLVAVQGPKSRLLVGQVLDLDLSGMEFYTFITAQFDGTELMVSRTGYSGELGFELYADPDTILKLWDELYKQGQQYGLQPCGLGARDTLRMEMKYCLYGNDITDSTNPIEAGLGWITKLAKGPFLGSAALTRIKEEGPKRRLVTFELQERGIPRHGYPIMKDGEVLGEVTSGTQSPTLRRGIGIGYVNRPHTKSGTEIEIIVRGKGLKALVVKPPFVGETSLMS
jgi:aminomethyltransferase